MGVHVPQDGHRLHGVRVPDTDVRVLPHLTCRHLDLIRMHGQTEKGRRRSQQFLHRSQRPTAELDFLSPHCDLITRADLAAADEAFNRSAATICEGGRTRNGTHVCSPTRLRAGGSKHLMLVFVMVTDMQWLSVFKGPPIRGSH